MLSKFKKVHYFLSKFDKNEITHNVRRVEDTFRILNPNVSIIRWTQIVTKFFTKHGSVTAVLCAEFQNDLMIRK